MPVVSSFCLLCILLKLLLPSMKLLYIFQNLEQHGLNILLEQNKYFNLSKSISKLSYSLVLAFQKLEIFQKLALLLLVSLLKLLVA